jgi:hypothetical protein
MLASAVAAFGALLAFAPPPAHAAQYGLVKSYQGKNFFNDWIFYNKVDNLTNGKVMYVIVLNPQFLRPYPVAMPTSHCTNIRDPGTFQRRRRQARSWRM